MEIERELTQHGFVFLEKWKQDSSIENLASLFGNPVRITDYLGHDNIPSVQQLHPQRKSTTLSNQYSGHYGLGEFPFHTDMAHWNIPPKYLILRCSKGYAEVSTRVVPLNLIKCELKELGSYKAIVTPRKNNLSPSCFLPVTFEHNGTDAIRWDSLFLEPVNSNARAIKKFIESKSFVSKILNFKLVNRGDTLIVNNYQNLHGRSYVPEHCVSRKIERIYIN